MSDQATTAKQSFLNSWKQQEARIAEQLPPDVPLDKFKAVVFRAVQEDASLLTVDDKMSLFLACQRAAQDGLIPDKRQGALVVYNNKVGGNWVSAVQWMPMIGGIRKRVAELGFDIRARVVYANDFFDQEQGDDEKITHKPAPLGEERGEIVGVYAIATDLYTNRVYREVMRKSEIEEIRACAKTQNIWNKWYGEKARVAVSKRLAKNLPLADAGDKEKQQAAERFQAMIDRDNEDFEPSGDLPMASDTAERAQAAARSNVRKLEKPKPETKPESYQSHFYQPTEPEPARAAKTAPAEPEPLQGEIVDEEPPEEEESGEFEGMEAPF